MAGYVILTCKYHKEDRFWVGICEELGTSMFGRTLEEAKEKLEDATLLHLNSLEEVGERNRFFAEHGIQRYSGVPRKDIEVSIEANADYYVRPCVLPIKEPVPA